MTDSFLLVHVHFFMSFSQILRTSSQMVKLHNLAAYSVYVVYVEACRTTTATCTPSSDEVTLSTPADLPQHLSAAIVDDVTSTSASLSWSDPQLSNGRILRSDMSNGECDRYNIPLYTRYSLRCFVAY